MLPQSNQKRVKIVLLLGSLLMKFGVLNSDEDLQARKSIHYSSLRSFSNHQGSNQGYFMRCNCNLPIYQTSCSSGLYWCSGMRISGEMENMLFVWRFIMVIYQLIINKCEGGIIEMTDEVNILWIFFFLFFLFFNKILILVYISCILFGHHG